LFSGEDTISTRGIHEKQQRWRPVFKCILVCNDIPKLDDNSWPAWRRLKVIGFPTSFVDDPIRPHERQKDPKIGQKLSKCTGALLCILIDYLARFKKTGQLLEAPAVTAATEKYKTDNDVFEEFREECLVEEEGARLDWKDVALPAFRNWAARRSKRIPNTTKEIQAVFVEKLGKIFNSRFKGTSLYGWRNIRLVKRND